MTRTLLLAAALTLIAGVAQATAITSFKGELSPGMYGTYAPAGDCSREPLVTVDESGLAYRWHGRTTHSVYIETAISMGGRGYQGISSWYFPFAQGYNDWGNLLLTFNPGERPGTLGFTPAADSDWSKLRSLTPLQAALAKGSPYAKCGKTLASTATAKAPATIAPQLQIGSRVNKPTAEQVVAIGHAMGAKIKCFEPDPFCYSLSVVDVNGDGRPDLVIDFNTMPYPCGATKCGGAVLLATANGYAGKAIGLPSAGPIVHVLPGRHHGLHDLNFQGWNKVWKYDGQQYQ